MIRNTIVAALAATAIASSAALAAAGTANATRGDVVGDYATEEGPGICKILEGHPGRGGLMGLASYINDQGFTREEVSHILFFLSRRLLPQRTGMGQ